MLFDGIVARKEGFLAYKNVILIKLKKNIFSKWLHHKFGHKFEISSGTVFLWLTLKYDVWWSIKSKRTLSGLKHDIVTESMLFDGIVATKEGFVAYKNVILTE